MVICYLNLYLLTSPFSPPFQSETDLFILNILIKLIIFIYLAVENKFVKF